MYKLFVSVIYQFEVGMKNEKMQIFSINNSKRERELAINLSIIGIPIAVTSMLHKKDSVSTSLALYLT